MPLNKKIGFAGVLFLSLNLLSHQNVSGQQREIDSLKKVVNANPKNDTNKVIALNALAYDYYTTNLDDLKVYANKALILAQKLKYKRGQGIACKNIGLGYLGSNANPLALDYFDLSLKIFRALHDKDNSSRVLNNIGYYYGLIKDHQHEAGYLLQAMQEADSLNEPHVKGVILGNIGNSYEAIGQLKKARDYYNQALAISSANNLQADVAAAYANLASVDLKEKNTQRPLAIATRY